MSIKSAEQTPVLPSTTVHLEKRRERRYPVNEAVKVRVFPYAAMPISAKILDVSRSGMKLELPTPMSPGTRIEILMPMTKLAVFGDVRYCRKCGEEYHAGVLIADVIRSKPDTTHLHDDQISLYVVRKGLTATEVLRVETHLSHCAACKQRMVEITNTLYATPRRLTPRQDIAP